MSKKQKKLMAKALANMSNEIRRENMKNFPRAQAMYQLTKNIDSPFVLLPMGRPFTGAVKMRPDRRIIKRALKKVRRGVLSYILGR